MKQKILFLVWVLVCAAFHSNLCFARKFPCEKEFQPVEKGLWLNPQSRIYMADTTGISGLLKQYTDKHLVVIVSSSSGCGGTPYAIEYINELQKRNYNVQYVFILGDDLNACADFPLFFKEIDSNVTYVIPSKNYKAQKFNLFFKDGRSRSDNLLKDVFPVAKEDIIATPKFYIMRPKTGELLFRGMRGYKNPYPKDVVKYFLEESNK